jgi:HAD superfamily hydrolase (TIGR01509 family)
MPIAIILDMDGLMLDTEPISLRIWKEAAVDLGYVLSDELCVGMVGRTTAANMTRLRQHFGAEFPAAELERSAGARYRAHLEAHGVPRKPGLEDFLSFLDERGLARAVATSTATDLARRKLDQAGVLGYFEVIVGGDQVSRGKPEPDIFLMAATRLGYAPADCVVLEDSGPGIQAAAAAGMRPILIPDGRTPAAAASRAAHATVESLSAARQIIESFLQNC